MLPTFLPPPTRHKVPWYFFFGGRKLFLPGHLGFIFDVRGVMVVVVVVALCLAPVIATVGANYRPALAAVEVASLLGITYIKG
jgi:hypothetical protein